MEINANILRILNNNLKVPAFILDHYGELLTLNEIARKLYSREYPLTSFWTLFAPECAAIVKNTFNKAVTSNKSLVESTTLLLPDNEKKNVEITFSGLGENGAKLILCTFDFNLFNTGNIKFSIKTEELNEIIKSEIFNQILEEIRSSFPFTLLGKAKIRNEINKLDEFFWLKDMEGKYLLVNNKFARNLGLKPAQLEGKYEKEFLPKYLTGFFDSIDEFIEKTSNIVIREGLTQPISTDNKDLSIVEFPLCDLDNRAIAIIGIGHQLNNQNDEISDAAGQDFTHILNLINFPAAILNNYGEIQNSNQPYNQLISEISILEKEQFYDEVKALCSDLNNIPDHKADVKKSIRNQNVSFVFNVRKLYNRSGNFNSFLLQVNKYSEDINTEILLNNRGKMYEILMQASPEPMYIYDIENLRFLEVNKAALDMYGYSRNEFLQMDLTDLYAPEDIQTLLDSGNTRSKEGVFTGPWRHKKRDGSSILVEISKVSFEYKESKAHFNIIRDVTKNIELNRELQLYKNIFENTSEMIFITDPEGFVTFANNSALNTLGYSKEDLDTRPIITLVSDDFRSDVSNLFYSSGEINYLSDIEFKKKDGSLIILDLQISYVYDYSEQIISYNIIAKEKNKQNTLNPEPITPKEVQSSSIDSALLSSMFHEILTPINVILGFVQEITENIQDPTEEIKEASEIINQNRQLLLQTMDSVLEYSHIEQKRVQLKPDKIFFTDILDNLQKNTKKTADSNNIEFAYGKISSSLNIETDVHRMESLMTMFITSAMRITKEKTVFISAYQYDDQNYIITLKDNRRSISSYLSESLCQVFTSDIKDLKKDYGLSKLSIHLARKLVTLLKGKFECIKKSNEVIECGFVFPFYVVTDTIEKISEPELIGSNIVNSEAEPENIIPESQVIEEPEVILPEKEAYIEPEPVLEKNIKAEPLPEPTPIPEPAPVQSTSNKQENQGKIDLTLLRCLYVEDQIDSQILFKVQMKDLKHIDFAVSFEAALPLLEQNKYDFIIMDINLQGEYNGLDALRIIRRLPGYDRIQIVAVTAYVLPGDKEKFIAAGFNDFISKPILREKLISSLNKILI